MKTRFEKRFRKKKKHLEGVASDAKLPKSTCKKHLEVVWFGRHLSIPPQQTPKKFFDHFSKRDIFFADFRTGWWFQTFLIFTPTWGNDPIWLIFSNGLKPPTREILSLKLRALGDHLPFRSIFQTVNFAGPRFRVQVASHDFWGWIALYEPGWTVVLWSGESFAFWVLWNKLKWWTVVFFKAILVNVFLLEVASKSRGKQNHLDFIPYNLHLHHLLLDMFQIPIPGKQAEFSRITCWGHQFDTPMIQACRDHECHECQSLHFGESKSKCYQNLNDQNQIKSIQWINQIKLMQSNPNLSAVSFFFGGVVTFSSSNRFVFFAMSGSRRVRWCPGVGWGRFTSKTRTPYSHEVWILELQADVLGAQEDVILT